jgi:hypothetical protein
LKNSSRKLMLFFHCRTRASNVLTDKDGETVRLKRGAEVDVTIEADEEDTAKQRQTEKGRKPIVVREAMRAAMEGFMWKNALAALSLFVPESDYGRPMSGAIRRMP